MELSDVLTTQDGVKAFLVTQDSLLLCFALFGPTYQAARERCLSHCAQNSKFPRPSKIFR